jgi:hypothetical protein
MNNSVLTFLANTSAVGGSGETAKKKEPSFSFDLAISTCELQHLTLDICLYLCISIIACVQHAPIAASYYRYAMRWLRVNKGTDHHEHESM